MSKYLAMPQKNSDNVRGSSKPNSKIIAIGGGKGGVGKSFVSSNIALFLANMGYKTVIIDLDLGGANAHTTLGEGQPKQGISDFISGAVTNLENLAIATKQPNLRLISGCNDDLETPNLSVAERSNLMSAIHKLPADYIILDLSAGTHQATIDFFLMAQHHLVVFTPEPSSIENAYRFMKACFFRKVKRHEKQLGLEKTFNEIMYNKNKDNIKHPADLITALLKLDPEKGTALLNMMQSLEFNIILNQTRTYKDADVGHSVQSVSNKFFGLSANYIGHLDYDNAVWQSLRKRKPLLVEYPHSRLYAQILNLSKSIAYSNKHKAVV